MAERETTAAQPAPAELLRAALEKIVFFEWRVTELAAELAAAQARCASAERERAAADTEAQAALEQARTARRQLAALESDRARLASLLAEPTRGLPDTGALEAEQRRSARLEAELEEARRDLGHQAAERQRWLNEMIAQTRDRGEEPAALAQFISELRGEVIALRAKIEKSDAMLRAAGLTPPTSDPPAPRPLPRREPEPVRDARQLLAQGRLTVPSAVELPVDARLGTAARALAEQCLKSLVAGPSSRREQAARHLAASPLSAAAPALAAALGEERDPKARAQLARALGACGGESAGDVLAQLQSAGEPALVRLAALDALAAMPGRLRAALEAASRDEAAAVRRRAAALATAAEQTDLAAKFAADESTSVRRAVAAAQNEAPAPVVASGCTSPLVGDTMPAPQAPFVSPPGCEMHASTALLAVQTALFGLTEAELAEHIGVPEAEAKAIAKELVEQGRLGRRGKRLVMAAGGAQ